MEELSQNVILCKEPKGKSLKRCQKGILSNRSFNRQWCTYPWKLSVSIRDFMWTVKEQGLDSLGSASRKNKVGLYDQRNFIRCWSRCRWSS